jgi:hypothetical protein
MKRPLILVALFYVAGILLARSISFPLGILLASSLVVALLALAWIRMRPILLCPLIIFTGWSNAELSTAILSPHDVRRMLGDQPHLLTARGVIRETPTHRLFVLDEKESVRRTGRGFGSKSRPLSRARPVPQRATCPEIRFHPPPRPCLLHGIS